MKAGFTLIELLLAVSFSGVLITLLFTSFFQINRSTLLTQDLIDMDMRFNVVQNQLEKDLTGAFVPVQAIVQEKKEDKPKEQEAQKKEKAATEAKEKKEKPKLLNDIFYSSNKGDVLNELTFVTNNPMRVYEYAKNAKVKPRIVRVVYRLVTDKDKKGTYNLMRQEGTDLELAQYKSNVAKPIKAFELINNIKSLTVEFKAPVVKEEKKDDKDKDKKKEQAQAPKEFETKKEWRSNEIRENKKKQSQMPQFVAIKLTLWDNQQEVDRSMTFNYQITAFGQDLITTKTQPVQPDEKEKKEKAQVANQENKKIAYAERQYRTRIADIKSSLKEFVDMLNGKNI